MKDLNPKKNCKNCSLIYQCAINNEDINCEKKTIIKNKNQKNQFSSKNYK